MATRALSGNKGDVVVTTTPVPPKDPSSLIIRIGNEDYRFTVEIGGADVSTEVAKKAIEQALEIMLDLVGKNSLEKGSITLSGSPGNAAGGVRVLSAEVFSTLQQTQPQKFDATLQGVSEPVRNKIAQRCEHISKVFAQTLGSAAEQTVPTVDVDRTGHCLDYSIAYQALRRVNIFISHKASQVTEVGNQLRKRVHEKLKDTSMKYPPEFYDALKISIGDIPAVKGLSEEDANASPLKKKGKKSRSEEKILDYVRLALEGEIDNEDNQQTLRNYYADYIGTKRKDGTFKPTGAYLDSAFMAALVAHPLKVTLKGKSTEISSIAVLDSSGKLIEGCVFASPAKPKISKQDTIFVVYDKDHYQALDTDKKTESAAVITAAIQKQKKDTATKPE